jgi:(R,R)-butanediol dehydrogenase / meso-butanediol dehydrogenase / diacetyl reductase
MKAAIFQALHTPLALHELPDPQPRARQVLINVCRCGICGSDLHMTEDPVFGATAGDVLGHEYAGEVLELGPDVRHLRVGDRVTVAPLLGCGDCDTCLRGEPAWCTQMTLQGGGYAQYAAVAERQCRRLPSHISLADGALAEPLAVALHGVMQSGTKPGDKVLVLGAGAIGLAVAFWARRLGASQVAMTDLHTFQQDRALDLGATAFFGRRERLVDDVNAAMQGPPDIVFECVGKPGLIAQAVEHARPRGTIVVLGLCTVADSFVPFRAVSKELKIINSVFFTMQEFGAAIDALEGSRYAPQALVSETISLAQLPLAFEALRQRSTQCKVLIDPFR